MKKTVFLVLLACLAWQARAMEPEQVKPVKNLIVLIPDGTSLATISTARWYQWYMNPDMPKLAIDPYICGTVRTHSSNAPIGDSAPTTSCYMTGHPSRTGYVATYPPHDPGNDIYPMDPKRAYQPMTTLLEAMKLVQHKATGLVFTCEFTHATPADCSAHSYSRKRYEWIAPQMVHNDIDVVIGGGTSLLDEAGEAYLKANGYNVYRNDMAGMRSDNSNKMWALFGDRDMAYDIDRDPAQQPSIEEMTKKALDKLSKNENGFFLMVEGSKVDWAAHGNDIGALLYDQVAFDEAVKVALDFAKADGNTLVVITSDHGNANPGLIYGKECNNNFDRLQNFTHSNDWILQQINPNDSIDKVREHIAQHCGGMNINEEQAKELLAYYAKTERKEDGLYNYKHLPYRLFAEIQKGHTSVGWISMDHSSDYTELGMYGPGSEKLKPFMRNTDMHKFLLEVAEVSL